MINIVIISARLALDEKQLAEYEDFSVATIIAPNIELAVTQASQYQTDIFVLDGREALFSADMLCHFLSEAYPKAQSVVLTNEQPTLEMLQTSGFKARGYITDQQHDLLAKAIRVVHDGEAWLPRKLVGEMLNRFSVLGVQLHAA